MFNAIRCAIFCAGVLLGAQAFGAWETVVFRDDFNGPAGPPDPSRWVVNHPQSWWWVQGRSFFPSPTYHPGAPFPRVENGMCIIEHHLYNPYHLGTPKTTFLGGEIHTVMPFDTSRAYRFEARVKGNPYPNGLVTSFFTYGYDGSQSDELDFEFLSNKTNDNATYPEGDPVLTNTWNESQQCPEIVRVPGLDLTEWNTFRIYWYPGQRVDWTWLDPIDGETLLRTEDTQCLPDEAMSLYFNFWAPTPGWPDAHDPDLLPVQAASQNEVYTYAVDYVVVSVPEPGTLALLGVLAIAAAGVMVVRRKKVGMTMSLRRIPGEHE